LLQFCTEACMISSCRQFHYQLTLQASRSYPLEDRSIAIEDTATHIGVSDGDENPQSLLMTAQSVQVVSQGDSRRLS
jgi:hypothetical protein